MRVLWEELKIGDFFQTLNCANNHIYQKIDSNLQHPFNCVLINKGEICNIYTHNQHFSKVEVAFEIVRETNNNE